MKYLSLIFSLCLFLFLNVHVQAQHDHGSHDHAAKAKTNKESPVFSMTEIFMVYGNCGMCENRIEGALADVKGVHSSDWDMDTKVMTIKYDDQVIALDEIKKKIAAVGHDTDKYQAKDEIYNNLPGCCQYERPVN